MSLIQSRLALYHGVDDYWIIDEPSRSSGVGFKVVTVNLHDYVCTVAELKDLHRQPGLDTLC